MIVFKSLFHIPQLQMPVPAHWYQKKDVDCQFTDLFYSQKDSLIETSKQLQRLSIQSPIFLNTILGPLSHLTYSMDFEFLSLLICSDALECLGSYKVVFMLVVCVFLISAGHFQPVGLWFTSMYSKVSKSV